MSYTFNDLCNAWCSKKDIHYRNDNIAHFYYCNGDYLISYWRYYSTRIITGDYRYIGGTHKIISLTIDLSYTTVSTMKRIRVICGMYGISAHIKNGKPIVTYKGNVIAVNRYNIVCIMIDK